MCGIFGIFVNEGSTLSLQVVREAMDLLFQLSESRGKEASGVAARVNNTAYILKGPIAASKLIRSDGYSEIFREIRDSTSPNGTLKRSLSIIGHSRLVTNGQSELNTNNQPVVIDGAVGVHNGIIVNDADLWSKHPSLRREYNVDTEVFLRLLLASRGEGNSFIQALRGTFTEIQGSASVAVLFDDAEVALLGTNTGSLFTAVSLDGSVMIFASEKYILSQVIKEQSLKDLFTDSRIQHVNPREGYLIDTKTLNITQFPLNGKLPLCQEPKCSRTEKVKIVDYSSYKKPFFSSSDSNLLTTENKNEMMNIWEGLYSSEAQLKRCTRCLLPETLPFITFDDEGVCNHCRTYEARGEIIKGEKALEEILVNFRSSTGNPDCVVGFSGGRDSSYGLWYLKEHLKMNPITFIYDWGMVTDVARRNQARVCGILGIEQIVISADIKRKRENIRKNLEAWLKKPDLGMVPILMAGDKQFYRYFHKIREENGIKLFVFCGGYEGEESTGVFKLGFCGVNRDAGSAEFRMTGINYINKMKLIWYYVKNYLKNPAYINSSIFDTLLAYYASYILPDDYVYLYNYLEWDEETILSTIRREFNWEQETDTIATWRTDDGTAALYNYIYMTMAGFTEYDMIRSHQIREGKLSRKEALGIVKEENKPRFQSLEWYAQAVNVDVNKIISSINSAPRLYKLSDSASRHYECSESVSSRV